MTEIIMRVNNTYGRIAGPISAADILDEPLITYLKNQMKESLLLEVPQDVEGEFVTQVEHRFDYNDYRILMEWHPLHRIEVKEITDDA